MTGNEANEAMATAKELERLEGVYWRGRFALMDEAMADALCLLGREYRKLRQIAARVPARTWIKAKEDAGHGTAIVANESAQPDRVHCHVCGELVLIYDGQHPEEAVCPEHCPDHEYEYERGDRKHYCKTCGQEPPPDFYRDDNL